MRSTCTVVTGGAGFLGSHLCEFLVRAGNEVVAVDDLSTGSYANIAGLIRHPRFTFVRQDVTKPYFIPCSRLYNLACPASPSRYQRDPIQTTLTSVLGALHGLELAETCGARFLQASTSEVYGDPQVHPQSESYLGNVNPTGPRACYDEGKRCAESLVMDHRRTRGTDVRIARIFNTYGPNMATDDGRVISNFIAQALSGRPLTIYGDGEQTRSFCYVDDMIAGLVALMECPENPGPTNLGNPTEVTVMELAREVLRLTGSSSDIERGPLPVDDPVRRRPDITRAQNAFGFRVSTPLREGLRKTVDSMREVLANPANRLEAEAPHWNGHRGFTAT